MIFQVQPNPIEQLLTVLGYWDYILAGFIMTMWLYMWALLMGFFLGLMLAILRVYGGKALSRIAAGYIEIIRGTPLLAQLLFLNFLPVALNISVGDWSIVIPFTRPENPLILLNYSTLVGILSLGLNSAAYQAEYFRGAIISVGAGQLMAAQSLGMSRLAGITHIVLPQALRRVIPAWSNEAAYLPKYTVVVYFVGVLELFAQAHAIFSITLISLITYIIVAFIFLVTISLISKGLDILHKRTAIPGL